MAEEITSLSADWLSTMDLAHSSRVASLSRSLSPELEMLASVIRPSCTVISTCTSL